MVLNFELSIHLDRNCQRFRDRVNHIIREHVINDLERAGWVVLLGEDFYDELISYCRSSSKKREPKLEDRFGEKLDREWKTAFNGHLLVQCDRRFVSDTHAHQSLAFVGKTGLQFIFSDNRGRQRFFRTAYFPKDVCDRRNSSYDLVTKLAYLEENEKTRSRKYFHPLPNDIVYGFDRKVRSEKFTTTNTSFEKATDWGFLELQDGEVRMPYVGIPTPKNEVRSLLGCPIALGGSVKPK